MYVVRYDRSNQWFALIERLRCPSVPLGFEPPKASARTKWQCLASLARPGGPREIHLFSHSLGVSRSRTLTGPRDLGISHSLGTSCSFVPPAYRPLRRWFVLISIDRKRLQELVPPARTGVRRRSTAHTCYPTYTRGELPSQSRGGVHAYAYLPLPWRAGLSISRKEQAGKPAPLGRVASWARAVIARDRVHMPREWRESRLG